MKKTTTTMLKFYAPLLLLVFCINYVRSEPTYAETRISGTINNPANPNHRNTLLSDVDSSDLRSGGNEDASNYDKRVERYAFGLGRRAYTYTNGGNNGVKRLPVYNFGLGKRARPYSFGLGKRAEYDDDQIYDGGDGGFERSNGAYNLAFMDEKRNRPYSFGLGKRDAAAVMDDVNQRGYPNRYGFGLGRR